MKTVFVDANVYLRFFTRDDEGQHQKASRLFREARDGKMRLLTGPPVLFEVAWTLRSAYNVSPERILNALQAILAQPGSTLTDKETVEQALALARSAQVEFPDAYIAALAHTHGATAVATFNKSDFRKLNAPLHTF